MLNLDTNILLFNLSGELRPSELKKVSENDCCVSVCVLWEINKLFQLRKIAIGLDHPGLAKMLGRLTILPVTEAICRRLPELDFVSDPTDELIAATSIAHGVPLLTRDKKILRSKVVPLAV